jgi:cytochrome b561
MGHLPWKFHGNLQQTKLKLINNILDNIMNESYHPFSKFLHWAIALLFLWQFSAIGLKEAFDETAFSDFLWSTHKPFGLILFGLIIVLILWSLISWKSRPEKHSILASLGHLSLYLLMFIVPLVALLRQYGSGREFSILGMTIMEKSEEKIQWMIDAGSLLHCELSWLLLALTIGHIFMAIYHHKQDGKTLDRML